MYNRDRRISSILSHLDDLSDIDTRAADELRAVHHEHSITSFLEGLIPPNEEIHGCNSPLAHENIGKSRAVETTPDPAPSQQQTIAKDAPTPKAPILSAPQPGKRRRRGTWENGTTMRRPRELDNPPPSPIIPMLFGDCPNIKAPSTLKTADLTEGVDTLDKAVLDAKPKE
ncbi:hypothetical protein IMSHALPRED_009898 [Imshaugia aleurites]|uniref:Uncharacterized protein n=1 Tax=Imshaugia aleurites TaxID=172621 RepID=A0A8H3IES5_9LECA|nr:hypothetical protein IMSHALPRED_009898 [Imshaugia aleurites]